MNHVKDCQHPRIAPRSDHSHRPGRTRLRPAHRHARPRGVHHMRGETDTEGMNEQKRRVIDEAASRAAYAMQLIHDEVNRRIKEELLTGKEAVCPTEDEMRAIWDKAGVFTAPS